MCLGARDILIRLGKPPKRQTDHFALGKSYILEAKLRTLRKDPQLDTPEQIEALYTEAKNAVSWKMIGASVTSPENKSRLMKENVHLTWDQCLNLEKAKFEFLCVWADIETEKTALRATEDLILKAKKAKKLSENEHSSINAIIKALEGSQAALSRLSQAGVRIDQLYGDTIVTLAETYLWSARSQSWRYYDNKSGVDPTVLDAAIKDYKKAMEYYDNAGRGVKQLHSSEITKILLVEEKAMAEFIYYNATQRSVSSTPDRIANYQKIAIDIRNVLRRSTDTTGLRQETARRVAIVDRAEKIKASLTLIAIISSLSDPALQGQINTTLASAVNSICNRTISREKDLYVVAAEIYRGISHDPYVQSNDPELLALLGPDNDPAYIRLQAAENSMILILKTTGRMRSLIEDINKLKREADYSAREGQQSAIAISDKLAEFVRDAEIKKMALEGFVRPYREEMDAFLRDALSQKGEIRARALILKAMFISWTAVKKDELKEAAKLFKQAQEEYPDAMDAKAKLAYAKVLVILTLAKVADRSEDARALLGGFGQGSTELTGIAAEEGQNGAKACVMMANLLISRGKLNIGTLEEARRYAQNALSKLTGVQQPANTLQLIGAITDKGIPVDQTVIEALCCLGVIEARMYLLEDGENRKTDHIRIKKILDDILAIVEEPYKTIALFDDGSLQSALKELYQCQGQVVLSYAEALKGTSEYAEFIRSEEYLKFYLEEAKFESRLAGLQDQLKRLWENR